MERTIRLTWTEVAKWLTLIVGIVATFVVMQTKVAELERGRDANRHDIEILGERLRIQEAQISAINEKLKIIGEDVTVIKNAIVTNSFVAHK